MSAWTRTHSQVYQGIGKERIWQLWTDINNWPMFHEDLEYCKLEGDFAIGNHFTLKPKGASAVKIEVTDINPGKGFTDCTCFFGARMVDTHEMLETPEGLQLTNTLTVTGPLKWLWIKLVAKNVANSIPEQMEALVAQARARHA